MKQTISIVGGGACALMLGCGLDPGKYAVTIYEGNAAPGRKFLVAGEGGLNLTHSEPAADFIQRYSPFAFLQTAFQGFSNRDLVAWLHGLGIETLVGSSGRVFPQKGMKPVEVLNVLLNRVKENGVTLKTRHEWKGFDAEQNLLMKHLGEVKTIKSDLVIFCLGGASWPVTGSKGNWLPYFESKNIRVIPFGASNCAFTINWPAELQPAIEGKALKNCTIRCGTAMHAGEVVLTRQGMEGSGIYPLSPQIRQQLHLAGNAEISIDLKPAVSREALLKKLEKKEGTASYSKQVAAQLNLNPLHMALLKRSLSKTEFLDPEKLVAHVKDLRFLITGTGPIEDAISTVGGIALEEINAHFELKKLPGHFAIGEMLDFDAPTGGYLLQAAFTMGHHLAMYLNTLPTIISKSTR